MTARTSRVGGAIVGALALLVAAPANAGMGDGIRLGGGDGVLHPFLELSAAYDTNVYTSATGPQPDVVFHIRPGFRLDVPGDAVVVEARAAAERVQYLGISKDTPKIDGWWGDAGLRLAVNPKGHVGLELRDAFRRSNQVQALSLGVPTISNYNVVSAMLPIMPGGGALIFAIGGDWAVEGYEPIAGPSLCPINPTPLIPDPRCDGSLTKKLGYQDVQGRGSFTWKFLPRTQATVDAGYSRRLPNDKALSPEVDTLRALAGVSGLVTTQLGATIRGGYGASTGTGIDYKTWLATFEVEWLPVAESSMKLGYTHNLGTEPGAGYAVYSMDRFSVDAHYKFARRVDAKVGARYDRVQYQVTGNSTVANVVAVEPALLIEAAKWLRFDLGYAFTKRTTDYQAPGPKPLTYDYDRHTGFLRVALIY